MPTGPDGASFKYSPTNAEDIFEQVRARSLSVPVMCLLLRASRLPGFLRASAPPSPVKVLVCPSPSSCRLQTRPLTNLAHPTLRLLPAALPQFFGRAGMGADFAQMFGGGGGGPSMFYATSQGRPQGVPRAPWSRAPANGGDAFGAAFGRDSPGMGMHMGGGGARQKAEAIEMPLRCACLT